MYRLPKQANTRNVTYINTDDRVEIAMYKSTYTSDTKLL